MRVTLVFPVYNESRRIQTYVEYLLQGLKDYDLAIILIDDCSTDTTPQILDRMARDHNNVCVFRNESNLGHGPTVIRGLRLAVEDESSVIISSDSDGEISLEDFASAISISLHPNFQILEGVRENRASDPIRNVVSFMAKVLVAIKSGQKTSDANTPFRAYNPLVLRRLLSMIPDSILIPNIWFSIYARRSNLDIETIELKPNGLKGAAFDGSSWSDKTRLTQRINFLKFSYKAFRQVVGI